VKRKFIVKDDSIVLDENFGQERKNSTADFTDDEIQTVLSDEDGKWFSPGSSGLLL
jgi:hypothetical protein